MLTAEEKIAYYYWFVLDKIKADIELRSKNDNSISYFIFAYPALNDPYKPNYLTEQKIVGKLIENKIIEEIAEKVEFQTGDSEYSNPESAGLQYFLKVNQPEFKSIYEKYKEKIKQYEVSEDRGNTLFFNINGEILYISSAGKEYKTTLNVNNNTYLLLYCLANRPNEIVSLDDLTNSLNKVRRHAEEPTEESRLRSTIKSIKEALNYNEEGLFVSNPGYGIYCKVHIIK